jgi:hypothetical protein
MDEKCFSSLIVMKKSLHNGLCDQWKKGGGEKVRNNLSSMGPPFVMELAIYKQTTMICYVTNIHSINTLSSTFTFPQSSFCSCISYFLMPLCMWSLAPSFHFVQMASFPLNLFFFTCCLVISTWKLPFLVDQNKVMHVMVMKKIMLQI